MTMPAVKALSVAALLLVVSASEALAGERTVTLAIDKMTCSLCPLTVSMAIKDVAGVKDVAVDYKTKTATVIYDDARTTVGKLAAASRRAGYPARQVK